MTIIAHMYALYYTYNNICKRIFICVKGPKCIHKIQCSVKVRNIVFSGFKKGLINQQPAAADNGYMVKRDIFYCV